jgi:hypothetical protein
MKKQSGEKINRLMIEIYALYLEKLKSRYFPKAEW